MTVLLQRPSKVLHSEESKGGRKKKNKNMLELGFEPRITAETQDYRVVF